MTVIHAVLIATVNLFLYSEATDFQQIHVQVPIDSSQASSNIQKFVIKEKQRLDIMLGNDENDIALEDIRCFKGEDNTPIHINNKLTYYSHTTKKFGTNLNIAADQITADASTEWRCNFRNIRNPKTKQVRFGIKVIGPNITEVQVFVPKNDLEEGDVKKIVVFENEPLHIILSNNETNIEAHDVRCFKRKDRMPIDITKQSYDFNSTTKIIATRLQISADTITANVSTEWECTFKLNEHDPETKHVRFGIRVSGANGIILRVNDMVATLTDHEETNTDIYEYKFIYGETLTVTCENREKRGNRYGNNIILVYDEKSKAAFVKDSTNTSDANKLLDTKYLEGARIKCFSLGKISFVTFHAKNIECRDGLSVAQYIVIGCVAAALAIIAAAVSVYCWCVKNKNIKTYKGNKSTQILNDNFNQQRIEYPLPPIPNQTNNNFHTDIDNEYQYITC